MDTHVLHRTCVAGHLSPQLQGFKIFGFLFKNSDSKLSPVLHLEAFKPSNFKLFILQTLHVLKLPDLVPQIC